MADVRSELDEDSRVQDVACPCCGCLCDDLVASVRDNQLVSIENACQLAEPWYESITAKGDTSHRVNGVAVDLDAALDRATDLLHQAKAPLVYGLSRSSTPGQRAAIELAELLGATVDTTASVCHGPSIMAIQEVGESTCTLGEVRQRADVVVYWGCDPVVSHPRHLERYSLDPSSEFLPNGRSDRTLVVVDVEMTATAEIADHFIKIEPDRDFELINRLRSQLKSPELSWKGNAGVSESDGQLLLTLLANSRYGAVFFGLGIAQGHSGHLTVTALLEFVAELNHKTRVIARRMRIPGDVAGADSVLCWQTGFPFAVNFGRGYPRYNPDEFTANRLLENGEVDCGVIVGSESINEFTAEAQRRLRQIPVIALESVNVMSQVDPTVEFRTAIYGIHAAGTGYRMDETPIPLKSILNSPLPTDSEVLGGLLDRLNPVRLDCCFRGSG